MSRRPFRCAIGWLLVASLLSVVTLSAQQSDPPSDPATLMQRKLQRAQSILESLATEDFDALVTSSNDLLQIAQQQWIAQETPEYRAQLKDLWIVLEGLQTAAQERNLDGATLSYVQLTISCVKCHKALRKDLN